MNILFVCTGNTCRSPMAEGYLKSLDLNDVFVKSRGLAADGSEASQNSVAVLKEIGIDISEHLSKQVTAEDIAEADKIFCMSPSHFEALLPYAKQKLYLLGNGISDPFGMDIEVYRKTRDEIIKEIDKLFPLFTVGIAKREDIKEIALLEKICFSEPWSENAVLESITHGTKFFVCKSGKTVLGYMGISMILDEGYITNVAVFPEYRRKGVGKALLRFCSEQAEKNGLSFISLEVRRSNLAAINLYRMQGFAEEGIRKCFYSNPVEDAIIMTKRF